jgi:hypothetical protein
MQKFEKEPIAIGMHGGVERHHAAILFSSKMKQMTSRLFALDMVRMTEYWSAGDIDQIDHGDITN